MQAHTKAIALVACGSYALYCMVFRALLSWAEATAQRVGPQWLGLLAYKLLNAFSCFLGVSLGSSDGEGLKHIDPNRRYMIVWHPHGFLAWSALFFLCRFAVAGEPHGQQWFAMVAPALFRIPIVGEALLLVNGRRVDQKVVNNLMKRGASIAIQPGGVKEQLMTRHDQEIAAFPEKLGFIRQAIKHGVEFLLPVYIFRENLMFRRVKNLDWLSNLIYQYTGFGLPFVTARWGLPMAGLLPLPTEVHVRWGVPVEVGPKEENPTEERVQALYQKYTAELVKVFDRYAGELLPPEVAKKGLKVVSTGTKSKL